MNALKLSLAAFAASLALGGAANAQEESPVSFSFNVGAASDYVFRGFTQTLEDPQVYGGIDAAFGIGYAGVWASNVDFGDSTDFEFDLYAGVKPTLGPVSLDLAAIYYGYGGKPSGSGYAYWEFKAAGSVPAGPATLGVATYYSPDFFGVDEEAFYAELNSAFAIPETKFSLSGAVGHQSLDVSSDYWTWNAGVGFALTDNVSFDLRYHDTDVKGTTLADERVVIGVKAAF